MKSDVAVSRLSLALSTVSPNGLLFFHSACAAFAVAGRFVNIDLRLH